MAARRGRAAQGPTRTCPCTAGPPVWPAQQTGSTHTHTHTHPSPPQHTHSPPVWPDSMCVHVPSSPSHTRAVPSCDAVTRSEVLPQKLTLTTLRGARVLGGGTSGHCARLRAQRALRAVQCSGPGPFTLRLNSPRPHCHHAKKMAAWPLLARPLLACATKPTPRPKCHAKSGSMASRCPAPGNLPPVTR